jgi:hypothetical protein
MSRYVILDHDHPFLHFDVMLEVGGILRTWRLFGDPLSATAIAAETVGDHRIEYLDYEGPISGNRGRVVRWDSGFYEIVHNSPTELTLALTGARCRGKAIIHCDNRTWRFQGD